MAESKTLHQDQRLRKKQKIIAAAAGEEPADLVLKNARFINVFTNQLQEGDIAISQGVIAGFGSYKGREERDLSGKIVCPGLMDGHIHLESSLVAPVEFAKAVVPHGTVGVVTDPHEIANVMGTAGIDYMLQATAGLPLDVFFMLPSCVPATPWDESGARLEARDIVQYYSRTNVLGLAEMMNFYGIVQGDEGCLQKILNAEANRRRIDGHAPGLMGNALSAYISAGISTDHECSTLEEAVARIERGQIVMIREGTAAHNLDALLPLMKSGYADRCIFCSDDRHPSDLLRKGHIDEIIRRTIAAGADPILAIKAGSFNAARHFQLYDRGAIAPGYRADLIVTDDLQRFPILQVYKDGELLFSEGHLAEFAHPRIDPALNRAAHDTFRNCRIEEAALQADGPCAVIGLVNGEITTTSEGYAEQINPAQDILKSAVIERHHGTGHIGIGYLKGYGLRSGAVATSFAHDSHNIIAAGTSDRDIAAAVNRLTENHGGIVVENNGEIVGEVRLGIAGLMSDEPLQTVDRQLEAAKAAARDLGVNPGIDPFMTLSFLSLPVIPELRLTTQGVFDVSAGRFRS